MLAVDRVASEANGARGVKQWFYSCDFNEKCANVDYVLDFFGRVKKKNAAAYDRIQYIEQPTNRDLKAHPEKMHEAAKLKPVVIDESLVDFETLVMARELGYSGAALKACKGQTDSLLLAAAAQKFGMFLCVQDLTCPGASLPAIGRARRANPHDGGRRRKRTAILPGRQQAVGEEISYALQGDRRHGRDRRAQQDRPGLLKLPAVGKSLACGFALLPAELLQRLHVRDAQDGKQHRGIVVMDRVANTAATAPATIALSKIARR